MKKGNITLEEIENSKNELINNLNTLYDDQKQLQSYYMGNIVAGISVSIEEYKENLKRVTKDEIVAVINKLEPDTLFFLKRGDE